MLCYFIQDYLYNFLLFHPCKAVSDNTIDRHKCITNFMKVCIECETQKQMFPVTPLQEMSKNFSSLPFPA